MYSFAQGFEQRPQPVNDESSYVCFAAALVCVIGPLIA